MHVGVIEAPKFRWGFVYCVCAGRLSFSRNCCCIGLVLVRVLSSIVETLNSVKVVTLRILESLVFSGFSAKKIS